MSQNFFWYIAATLVVPLTRVLFLFAFFCIKKVVNIIRISFFSKSNPQNIIIEQIFSIFAMVDSRFSDQVRGVSCVINEIPRRLRCISLILPCSLQHGQQEFNSKLPSIEIFSIFTYGYGKTSACIDLSLTNPNFVSKNKLPNSIICQDESTLIIDL